MHPLVEIPHKSTRLQLADILANKPYTYARFNNNNTYAYTYKSLNVNVTVRIAITSRLSVSRLDAQLWLRVSTARQGNLTTRSSLERATSGRVIT